MKHLSLVLAFLGFSALASAQAPPAGKMWPLEELPRDYLRETHDFEPSDAWLERVRLASLRYGGGSASFVSPRGLILTNHHVVRGQVSRMEHDGKNLNTHGYVAHSLDEELPIPRGSAAQLVDTRDVTAEVFAGVDLGASLEERELAIATNRRSLVAKARAENPGLSPELVTMYRGARVHLYLYKIYDDIRLVFTPHLAVGYFGGHPDNFSYPHYALDFAILRAYEDGFPVDASAFYLEWRADPVTEGEVVFSSGNPGSTDRHLTVGEIEYQRDARYRAQTAGVAAFRDALIAHRKAHPERADALRQLEFSTVTGSKSSEGIYSGFLDETRLKVEQRVEEDLRRRIAADPTADPRWEAAFEEIDALTDELTDVYLRWWYRSAQYAPGRFFGPLQRAMSVVEQVHPDFVGSASRVNKVPATLRFEFEPELFAGHLERARDVLGADDPGVEALLQGREPVEAVAHLLENTNITSATYELELVSAGWETVSASDDPAIRAALVLYPLYWESSEEREFLEHALREQSLFIGQAIDAMNGPLVSPEATFTLRLSSGVVVGYEQLGTVWPASTNFYGLFGRCAEFGDEGDFDLPDIWHERLDRIDLATPLNLICTVDIIGGNSGSPLLDREARVVGTLFDGNFQMVENQFLYRDDRARAIAVHSAAMLETLDKVYDAAGIVSELKGEGGYR